MGTRPRDPREPLGFRVQLYGISIRLALHPRQLVALATFSDLVGEARERILADAVARGMPEGDGLEDGGVGARAYAEL